MDGGGIAGLGNIMISATQNTKETQASPSQTTARGGGSHPVSQPVPCVDRTVCPLAEMPCLGFALGGRDMIKGVLCSRLDVVGLLTCMTRYTLLHIERKHMLYLRRHKMPSDGSRNSHWHWHWRWRNTVGGRLRCSPHSLAHSQRHSSYPAWRSFGLEVGKDCCST